MTAAGTAGYSGTPLPTKLGIKAGHRVLIADEPTAFRDVLIPLPPDLTIEKSFAVAGSPTC